MHNKGKLCKYITNPINIEKHSFYPLLHYTICTKKYSRNKNSSLCFEKEKKREIYYASHIDAQIFSYYADLLSKSYEDKIAGFNYSDCISAYRRIQSQLHNGNKSSIDFANDIFKEIKSYGSKNKVILTFDIKGFFDNLDHKVLKQKWCSLLNSKNLPKDHYNVYKAITTFSYVNRDEYYKEYGFAKSIHIKWKEISELCTSASDFQKRIREKKLVKSNKFILNKDGTLTKKTAGIAQGTPISAFLSNLYLIDFDKELYELTSSKSDCLYRRYSDDIIICCNPEDASEIKSFVETNIREKYKLEINSSKSETFIIKNKEADTFSIFKLKNPNDQILETDFIEGSNKNKFYNQNQHPIQYLGFEFFGKDVLIKSSNISKHYIKLKRTVKRRAYYTRCAQNHKIEYPNSMINTNLFKCSLYRKLTHFGQKIKTLTVKKLNRDGKEITINDKKYWGNYLSYALKADKIMGGNKCYKQYKKHITIIQNEIARYEKKYNLRKDKPSE